MTLDKQRMLDAVLRDSFFYFLLKAFSLASGGETLLTNWHHKAICWQLDRIMQGDNTRLIVAMPPRNLKSIAISVAWVAWMLGRDPTLRIICVSYSAELSKKLARDCLAIMQSDLYQRLFPNTQIKRGAGAGMDFETTKGGGRLSTSVGGTLTGRGGDVIIIDDPIKPDDAMSEVERRNVLEWYSNTLVSRLNDKVRGSIILVMQRLHEEDLAGHLLEAGGWHHLTLQAIAEEDQLIPVGPNQTHLHRAGTALHPDREPITLLEQLKSEMGTARFSAQYQQRPVPAEGLHVQRAWFRYYETLPQKQPGDTIVQSWDTASKTGVFNDYSVCVTALIREGKFYILDVYRAKLKFPDLVHKVKALAHRWDANALLVEDAASGQQLIQTLKDKPTLGVPRPIARKPDADKVTRFSGQSHRIEAGELVLPKDAPWLVEFQRELLGFPNLKHDDQVDALTQLLAWRQSNSRKFYIDGVIPGIMGPSCIQG